jgi:hypothetical protein
LVREDTNQGLGLGLVNVYQLNPKPDPDFIIEKMADQAHELMP